jgi:glycyl-tRNA synthetase alpha chain
VAASYLDSRERLGFPMAPREWAEEVIAALAQQRDKKAA